MLTYNLLLLFRQLRFSARLQIKLNIKWLCMVSLSYNKNTSKSSYLFESLKSF